MPAAFLLQVHGVMYSYYTFSALRIKSPIPAVAITAVQLMQMLIGVVVHAACFYLYYVGKTHDLPYVVIYVAAIRFCFGYQIAA